MAFKFNPFTGNFDDVADVAEKVESSTGSSTDNAIVRWDGTSALLVQNSSVLIDDSNNITGAVNLTLSGDIDVNAAGAFSIGASVGANNLTLGGSGSTVVIPGNLQVDGTTTSVNSATLDVTDANITVNNGGNQAAADSNDAGITVEMSDATDAIIHYDSTSSSNWKIGLVGSSIDVADISSTQTFTNKTIGNTNNVTLLDTLFTIQDNSDNTKQVRLELSGVSASTTRTLTVPDANITLVGTSNTQTLSNKTIGNTNTIIVQDNSFTMQDNADNTKQLSFQLSGISPSNLRTLTVPDASDTIAVLAATQTLTNKTIVAANNTITTAASGNLTATELNAALAELQTDIDTRAVISDVFSITSSSGTFTATANETHLVNTSGGAATVTLPAASVDRFVRIKDSTGNAEANNITVSPASGTIDGAASDVIDSNYGSVVYVSDGTNWFKL